MEKHNIYLLVAHILLGTIGYISGIVALSSKKGSGIHIKSGKVFSYLMIIPAITTFFFMFNRLLPLAILMAIASLYLIASSILALRHNNRIALRLSKILLFIPILLLIFSIIRLSASFKLGVEQIIGPLLLLVVFLTLIIGDIQMMSSKVIKGYTFWLKRHLYRMSLAFGFVTIAVLNINAIEIGMPTSLTVIIPITGSLLISLYFIKNIEKIRVPQKTT